MRSFPECVRRKKPWWDVCIKKIFRRRPDRVIFESHKTRGKFDPSRVFFTRIHQNKKSCQTYHRLQNRVALLVIWSMTIILDFRFVIFDYGRKWFRAWSSVPCANTFSVLRLASCVFGGSISPRNTQHATRNTGHAKAWTPYPESVTEPRQLASGQGSQGGQSEKSRLQVADCQCGQSESK